MRWLMLCRAPQLYSCQRILAACQAYGIRLDILDPNRFLLQLGSGSVACFYPSANGEMQPLPYYQAVIPRFGAASTRMGCHVLDQLEIQGATVLNNAAAFAVARDKWRTAQRLAAAGIPISESFLGGELLSVNARFARHSGKIVLKTVQGMQGEGVFLAENATEAGAYLQRDPNLISQPFIAEAAGRDLRVFVIGTDAVAAMERRAPEGDFRANIHQGGSAQAVRLAPQIADLAVSASAAVGLEVAGVDLIQTANGWAVLEVNASAGLEMIEKVSGVAIAEKMVAYLLNKINEENNGRTEKIRHG